MPPPISPPAIGTHHSHIILLAVCRVGAGDALCRNGSTVLGGHGVHSGPEAKQTGMWVPLPSDLRQNQNTAPICTIKLCVHEWPWINHPEWFIWDSHGPCPGHGDWALKWQLINDPIVLQIKRCWLRCGKQDQAVSTKVIVLVKKKKKKQLTMQTL